MKSRKEFRVGDKVVYPMHGAGIIEAIEEKEVLGRTERYYVMRMPIGDLRVMIPMSSVEELGLREVIDAEGVRKVYQVLQGETTTMSQNWNRRYRANLEKIKSGDIFEVAEVVRNLSVRERDKGLSTGERKMLENARQILISELVLAQDLPEEQVESQIRELLS
ncbi:MAG: CarD family transcriptional regulator [Limnochordales bacterium]|nr:CarD family transcriptional regulator [Limnochordales bacterium]